MKILELLNENEDSGDAGGDSGGSSNAGRGGKSKKISKSKNVHDHYTHAIKGMETYTDDNSYYTMYRFGVDMARGLGGYHPYDEKSPVGHQMATIAYTDADQKIIDNSKKNLGLNSIKLTSKDSIEHPETHTSSPVAKIKRNRYGV